MVQAKQKKEPQLLQPGSLPPPAPKNTCTEKTPGPGPWHIYRCENDDLVRVVRDGVEMHYNVKKHGRGSGAAFFANPFKSLPADSATLRYEVFIPENFDFVICGKFPGLGFGRTRGEHASGGDWNEHGGSFRLMWQKPEGDEALVKGYLYLAIPGGPKKAKAWDVQGSGVKKALEWDDRTGYSLNYRKEGVFRVRKGQWNSVEMSMTLNTPGKADGIVSTTVNGVTRAYDDVVFRTDAAVRIQDVYWVSIFGGQGAEFSPKTDVPTTFRRIAFSAA